MFEMERVGWVVQSKSGEVMVNCSGVNEVGTSGLVGVEVSGEF